MPDLQSLRMVLDTMGGKMYKVIRQEVYDFNEFDPFDYEFPF